MEVEPERRKDQGLQAALASVFPIPDYNNTAALEFSNYSLGTPKYDERECIEQGMTFAVPLKLRVRLVVFDKEDKGPKKKVLDVREQEVYVGELAADDGARNVSSSTGPSGWWSVSCTARRAHPLPMTRGVRMPAARCCTPLGLFRIADPGSISSSMRQDILYVRIDRRRKMPATILLKAFGYSSDDLLRMYYPVEEIRWSPRASCSGSWTPKFITA